ncbi:MAG: 2-dehydropantoate 2-reductase [Thermaerobacter sp.]|nr:2-dehydropantoate 2-reductase [Thermaerobacter sp.]
MRYLVVGAGAIGGSIGAYMARAGEDVVFTDQDVEHVVAMQRHGLTIRGYDETVTVPVQAVRLEELPGLAAPDFLLLAVKAQHTREALAGVLSSVGPKTAVVSLQNGLNERTIAEMVGGERTIGCFVNFSADYLGPGLVHYGSEGALYVGELDGRNSGRLEALARAMEHFGTVHRTDNIWGYLWAKLGYATMLFATALADERMGDVVDRYRTLMVELACEVYDVADREGVRLMPFDTITPALYWPRERQDWALLDLALDRMVRWQLASEKTKSGIWRDIKVRHRTTEVDEQPGRVLAIGRGHGLRLPLTQKLVAMIHELERGEREMSWQNLEELEALRGG